MINAYVTKMKKKSSEKKTHRPNASAIKLLEKLRLALKRSVLLIRQLFCNFRRQRTVCYQSRFEKGERGMGKF
jgi:hypothetical protein